METAVTIDQTSPQSQSPPPAPQKQIFTLSGQSNMAGRGGVNYDHRKHWDSVVPLECRPDVLILRLSAALL